MSERHDYRRPEQCPQEKAPASQPPLPQSLAWALRYLPEYFCNCPAAFHRELMRDLENPENRLLARVAPRGHAKSTCAALAYPLWCLCEGRRRNILIITRESSLATQFVRDIRSELESNEAILATYGDMCRVAQPPRTGEHAPASGQTRRRLKTITAARKQTRPRKAGGRSKPTSAADNSQTLPRRRGKWAESKFITTAGLAVQAKGCGASLRGTRVGPMRPDLIICDDIEKDDLVESPEGRRKLENWLRRVVMPALAPEGQLVVVGSLIHFDCLLANLRDERRFPHWNYRVYRALEGECADDGKFRRAALWPARWPVEKLDEERERVGTLAFEQEYLANPIDTSQRTFKPEWLKRYEPAELESCAERLINLMAVDPATGESSGDFCAFWVGSVDAATGVIYTRVLSLERIDIVEQKRRIMSLYQQWRPVRVGIETVGYQKALKDSLEHESRLAKTYVPVVALNTIRSKLARIQGSSPFYENGTFRLPPVLDPEVEAQFLHFPKGAHDDAPDVCAMGIELAREFLGGQRVEALSGGRRRGFDRRAW
jgi:predicted phage terminase large subunit-like protein